MRVVTCSLKRSCARRSCAPADGFGDRPALSHGHALCRDADDAVLHLGDRRHQWNLVLGIGGIFSLAQMALFAVGAYSTAMLGYYFHLPMAPAMLLAALVTVLLSVLVGLACLRLRGPCVALLTLAVAQVLFLLSMIVVGGIGTVWVRCSARRS